MKTLLPLAFLTALSVFSSCEEEKDDYTTAMGNREGAVQMILDPADTGTSLLKTIVRSDTFRKLSYPYQASFRYFSYPDTFTMLIHNYNGILVALKDDSSYFLQILGVTDAQALDSTHVNVLSTIGKAVLDISNPKKIKPVSFQFDYQGYPPYIDINIINYLTRGYNPYTDRGSLNYYFECPNATDKIVYGWSIGTISYPKCYSKT